MFPANNFGMSVAVGRRDRQTERERERDAIQDNKRTHIVCKTYPKQTRQKHTNAHTHTLKIRCFIIHLFDSYVTLAIKHENS